MTATTVVMSGFGQSMSSSITLPSIHTRKVMTGGGFVFKYAAHSAVWSWLVESWCESGEGSKLKVVG